MIQIIIENGPRGQSGLGERGKAGNSVAATDADLLTRGQYGKPLAELTPEELETVQMAVPLNITEMELRNNPQPTVR